MMLYRGWFFHYIKFKFKSRGKMSQIVDFLKIASELRNGTFVNFTYDAGLHDYKAKFR